MHIAFTLFHDVRSRARERLGASAGLRGNGMAFPLATLHEVPYDAFSLVEDVEYGIRLGLAGDGDGGEFTIESRDFHPHPQMCKADGPRRKGSWSVEPERFLEF